MQKIKSIKAREILDSRGNPTVEADITLSDGSFGRASVPSGASTGIHEAVELRDSGTRFGGKGVLKAVQNVNTIIQKELSGNEFTQKKLDEALIKLDGTKNKSALGANALLAVSLAFAKAVASSKKIPLWKYFSEESGLSPRLPTPMMNILNGGKHAPGGTDIQEFMIVPQGENFTESLRMGTEVFHALSKILSVKKLTTLVGDEGGYAPSLPSNVAALELLVEAIQKAGFVPGKDISIAMDVAASSFYHDGMYDLASENRKVTADELIKLYEDWTSHFPLISIEDGLEEEDWANFKKMTEKLGKKVKIVGDDLFVTNIEYLKKGIAEKSANSVLVKLNQIGTLSETIETVQTATKAGFSSIISHRSGETEDTSIAHLAVGLGTGWIKTGAPCRSERTAKYNELLRIEESFAEQK